MSARRSTAHSIIDSTQLLRDTQPGELTYLVAQVSACRQLCHQCRCPVSYAIGVIGVDFVEDATIGQHIQAVVAGYDYRAVRCQGFQRRELQGVRNGAR